MSIITGKILDLDNKPIEGVKIKFIGSNFTEQDIYSNFEGNYRSRELVEGVTYDIYAFKNSNTIIGSKLNYVATKENIIQNFVVLPVSQKTSEQPAEDINAQPAEEKQLTEKS
jgi:hypothetical protein